MNRIIYITITLLSLCTISVAQEICNNGIDDDNDGFIDCFDNQCANNTLCDGFYIGNDAACEAKPSQFPAFAMQLDWASPNKTTNHLNRVSIGDLDRDGVPEVVTVNIEGNSKGIYILNGSNGEIKYSKTNLPFVPDREVVIGNIDNDNCAEIFLTGVEGGNRYFYAYNCDLTQQLWRSASIGGIDGGLFGLADFNGDGNTELYFRDRILNAHTGVQIADSPLTTNNSTIAKSPVAVDIVGDETLELVSGLIIFNVNIGAGTITEHSRRSEYFLRSTGDVGATNHTSVADYNLDGHLDIMASGSTISNNSNTTIFFWDVFNNTLLTYSDPIPGNFNVDGCNGTNGTYYANGWYRGTGRINIADLDGDGKLNAAYVSGKFLYALNDDLSLKWKKIVKEETSGYTGCTMFDFNGDGKTEIVYRDEGKIYIIRGDSTTATYQVCISRTANEYPIVADVDGDGQSEICVTCGFDDQLAIDNFCDLPYSENSHVRAFKTALEPWVPARRVWNQNAYFNVNINDDLTIPKKQQKHHLPFSLVGCDPSDPKPVRPLNTFLNQSPYLSSDGCPKYAAPNLVYVGTATVVTPPTCPETDFTVSFTVSNLGDIPLSGNVPITFYNGDPLQSGAVKLNTVTIPLINFNPGNVYNANLTVTGPGSAFTLFIAINDNGNSVPSPIVFPNTEFLECEYFNITSVNINPLPNALTALKVQDNMKCPGSTTPNNGAVRAFVPNGGVENIADYNFFWSNGSTVNPVPDFSGVVYSGIAEGNYTVFAQHKTVGCSSDTASVAVGRISSTVDVTIVLEKDYDNCKNPNGKLRAVVNDTDNDGNGDPVGNFTYAWYQGNDIFTSPQIGVSHVATDLNPLTYTVLVTDKITGCQSIESGTVPNNTVKPTPTTATVDIVCSSSNSGEASATVSGTTTGYVFDWFNGNNVKPVPDFTGHTYTSLTAGNYTVLVTDNSSKCSSDPVTVTVTQTSAPIVSISAKTDQTSCDALQSNGSASANVGGTTSGYTFEWFTGQNTLPANLVATGNNASNLPAGIYTVKATDNVTGCSGTEEVTINFAVVVPTLSIDAIGQLTSCSNPNGSITVGVSLDSPADYTFSWYTGPATKAQPDFPDTDNVLSGLPIDTYTVRAVHNTKHCTTPPISTDVTGNTSAITIIQNIGSTQLPTDCNANNGVMGVTVSAIGNTQGFLIEWFRNNSAPAFLSQTGVSSSTASNLVSASYTVRATNLDNGCFNADTFALPFADAHIVTLLSKQDVTTCNPANDGSAVIRLQPTPNIAFSVADYIISIYSGLGKTDPLVATINGNTGTLNMDANRTANYSFPTLIPPNLLTPGYYTFIAVENNVALSNCESVPVTVEILPFDGDPVITASATTNNTNCTGVVPFNGEIVAMADGANPVGYTFNWSGGVTTGGVNNNTATQLNVGDYTVTATNNATQCSAAATFTIFDNPPIISLTDADIITTALTRCDVNNGSAEIIGVSENGLPGVLGNYTIEWFDQTVTLIGNANPIVPLDTGVHYVRVTNTANNCSPAMIEFDIEDQTTGTVVTALTGFINPTRCLKPTNLLGELTIEASGTSGSGYTINWYNGNSASGSVIGNAATLSALDLIGLGQSSADYTVQVINNDNQCDIAETYTLPLETSNITITASSASPMTNCRINDGVVFATVTSGSSNSYTYNWYVGGTITPQPNFVGKEIDNLSVGTYTVQAIDQADNFCTAGPLSVTIDDGREFPVVTAIEVAPLTICDPTRPDGVATVSANGGSIVNYIFDWYEGNTVTGTPFYTGVSASNLAATLYTIEATHTITGCKGTAQVAIKENKAVVPAPKIDILSHVTNCITNNGALSASVNDVTKDYIFDWSIGTVPKILPDFTGEIYNDLNEGIYTVVATERATACKSGPSSAEILKILIYPDIDFEVTNATCGNDNGIVSVKLLNNAPIKSIEWNINGVISYEPVLHGVPEGVYPVTVTTHFDCAITRDATVGTEIHPFNGISRNNDGKNDLFYIDCIESFPTNFVKIFNRAGTLVYEAEGYNNMDIFFDGRSNRGISPLGTNLPDGTYFYVIDKRDGSKQLVGYIEIVN